MDPHSFIARAEAQRWLGLAEKLLMNRDLLGSKTFAIRARDSDPRLEIADKILAITDTLMAADKRVGANNNQPDWYSILQLVQLTHDSELIASQYQRLALLLNPSQTQLPYADQAFQLVSEAWSVLSNPMRKSIYDSDLNFSQQQQYNPFTQQQNQYQQPAPQQQHNFFSTHNVVGTSQEQERPERPFVIRPHQQHNFLSQSNLSNLFGSGIEPELPTRPSYQSNTIQHQLQPLPQQPPPQQPKPQIQSQPQAPPPSTQPQPQPQQQQKTPTSQKLPQAPPPLAQPQIQSQPQAPPPSAQSQPQQQQQQKKPASQKQPRKKKTPTQAPRENINGVAEQKKKTPTQAPQASQSSRENRNGVAEERGTDGANEDGSSTFWTACPYCLHMYEYYKAYADCTLRCQNCKRAFQAVAVQSPPLVAEGKEADYYCWGFFPFGISKASFDKNKGDGSSWTPFSPMSRGFI